MRSIIAGTKLIGTAPPLYRIIPDILSKIGLALNLKRAVAGLKTAHLRKITSAFEFSVLTLTVPGLRP